MGRFIKTFLLFIYLFSALFVLPNLSFACENISQGSDAQYFISGQKNENAILNNKKEENYILSRTRSETKITKSSDENDNAGTSAVNKPIFNSDFITDDISEYTICPDFVSYNTAHNLRNEIYTRAP